MDLDKFKQLLELIHNYTINLANSNAFEYEDITPSEDNVLIDLKQYLDVQKSIFENAA